MAERSATLSSIDDMRLTVAIAEHGSVIAAAASLHVAQPSASQRLAALERRLGVMLFDRTTTGARATEAGRAFVERSRQALELALDAGEAARTASSLTRLRIGTFVSLSVPVFTAFDAILGESVRVDERVDHGGRLVTDVAGGVLDAAVVALPAGLASPRNTRRTRLGVDPLVLVVPNGVTRPAAPRSRPYAGHDVVLATYSSQPDDDARRLGARGAWVRPASTAPTALALARRRGCLAAVPRSAWRADRRDGERAAPVRPALASTLSLVVASASHPALHEAAGPLAQRLGLGR